MVTKVPRAPTAIPRDRDVRETKTPPMGSPIAVAMQAQRDAVAARIAAAKLKSEDWDIDALTPVGVSDFETLNFRARRASQAIATVNGRLDVMGETLGDVREELGKVGGALNTLVPLVQQQNANALQHQTVTLTAKMDIDKAQAFDVIEARKDSRTLRRELIIKVMAIATPIGAAIAAAISLLLGRC